MSESNEAVSIIVVGRDRFSPTEDCLEKLIAYTPQPYRLIVVLGGAPKELESRLRKKYGSIATLVFEPRFLNCSQSRNIGLKLAATRLSVCMDNDVFVRPGWLSPLVQCQKETSAGLVVPLILEDEHRIHCAGCDMLVTKRGTRAFAGKVLRYNGQTVFDDTNIQRREADYGEMHLQLVETKAALELGVYDDRIQEGQELDGGLIWRKAGRSVWCEPKSVVVYRLPTRVEHPEDIAFFCWRWNTANVVPGYKVMHQKWDMDMTEAGTFKYFLRNMNVKIGWLPRLWPSSTALFIDRAMGRAFNLVTEVPHRIRHELYGLGTGHYEWIREFEDGKPASRDIADKILRKIGLGGRRNEMHH
jgi:glycosyltransferase involved in cell wall biosynthesis